MFGARYFGTRYWAARYWGGATAGSPPPPTTGEAYYTMYIDDVLRGPRQWEVDALINKQTSCRFDILSSEGETTSTTGRAYFSSYYFSPYYFAPYYFGGTVNIPDAPVVYRPSIDQTVKLYEDSTLIFGGLITLPRESGLGNDEPTTIIRTTVNALDYKVLTQWRYVNETIPAGTLRQALIRINTYLTGITLDPTQVDGPALPELIYDYVKVEDALNGLTTLTGYLWTISYGGILSMFLPGMIAAPYDITPTTDDVTFGDIQVEPVREKYANRVIGKAGNLISIFNDAAEQAIKPIREALITAPDTTDQIGLDALVAAYALTSVLTPNRVTYQTFKRGFAPGQLQYIHLPKRNLNNYFTILRVLSRRAEGRTPRQVTALEGSTYQADFARSVYRAWSGGGAPVAGGGTPSGGGSGMRAAYPLSMVKSQGVRNSAPDWMDAPNAIHVQLNTSSMGTLNAIVKAQMRVKTAGNSVQARLYNVSLSAPVAGVSPIITTTTWSSMVSWNVALTAGAYVYKLQLLSGIVDEDVFVSAYLE